MKKQTRLTLAAILFTASLAVLSGCSSSPTDGETSEDLPSLDGDQASTDALPTEGDAELAQADQEFKDAAPVDAPLEGDPLSDLDAPKDMPIPAASATPEPLAAVAPPIPMETPAPAMEPTAVVAQPMESSPLPPMPASGGESYHVQRGDTLMKVAFEQYGDLYKWHELYEANRDKIPNPNRLEPGVVLTINRQGPPPQISRNGEQYMIRRGDTLGRISSDVYGTSSKWRKIWDNNRELIKDPNKIYAGFYLYYTMTPEDRKESEQQKQLSDQAPLADAGGDSAPADERAPASASK